MTHVLLVLRLIINVHPIRAHRGICRSLYQLKPRFLHDIRVECFQAVQRDIERFK